MLITFEFASDFVESHRLFDDGVVVWVRLRGTRGGGVWLGLGLGYACGGHGVVVCGVWWCAVVVCGVCMSVCECVNVCW